MNRAGCGGFHQFGALRGSKGARYFDPYVDPINHAVFGEAFFGKVPSAARMALPTLTITPLVTGLIDTDFGGDMLGAVPEEKERRGATRYEAVIATLIGLLAVCVSAYTAYMQRQQVRAAVWPILEFDSSNGPTFTLPLRTKASDRQSSGMSS